MIAGSLLETHPARSFVRARGPAGRSWILSWGARIAWAAAFPLVLLGLWGLSSAQGWLPPQILPSPRFVLDTLLDLAVSGELAFHAGVSFRRLILGFAVGAALGLAYGVASGLSRRVRQYADPLFLALAQVPALGWIPFVMILAGIDDALKVIVIAKASFVPVAFNTARGIRQVPESYREVGRVLGLGTGAALRRIVLPGAVPQIATGLRYGLTHAWMALVAVELIASSEGLGYLTVWGRQLFQLDILLAAMAVIGAVGFLLDRGLAHMERRVDRWRLT